MAQTFERSQTGKRESLSDVIAVVDAKKTPLFAAMPKGSDPANSLFEWQADAYDPPKAGAVVDGSDAASPEDAAEYRAILSNYTEEFRREPKVSKRANLSNVAGIGMKKEMARAISKKMFEEKRDIEVAWGSDNVAQKDNGTVGYAGHGLGSWISNSEQSVLPVDSAFRTPAASINGTAMASLTPALVNSVMESQYQQCGEEKTYMLICGTSLKKRFTQLAGYPVDLASHTQIKRTSMGDAGSFADRVQSWTGDFGTYDLVLSNWLGWNFSTSVNSTFRGYALDMDMLELRWQQDLKYEPLPDLGGGPRGIISAICGLCVKNPLGLAKFNATS